MIKPHIVILGAGFGGTYVAKRLAPLVKKRELDVTIINRTNYFLFTPLLHEVATGSLSPSSVAEPLREVFVGSGIELCQGIVESVNMRDCRIHITGAGKRHTLTYDRLIIATGAETNYYGIPGAEKLALPLKDLDDAARIRDRVIDSFEAAILRDDPAERSRLLSFAIVGGGPTGVELAAELSEFVKIMLDRYYSCTNHPLEDIPKCSAEEPKISLIHTEKELLMQFPESLRKSAEERLRVNKVNLHLGVSVSAVTPHGLTLSNNTTISAGTVIWTAGVKAIIPDFTYIMPEMKAGRLVVDEYFRVSGSEKVFALGDVASNAPMLAQAAVQQAKIVANNVLASLSQGKFKTFEFKSKGGMVSVGSWFAVGEIFSMDIAGKFAWWIWRTIYLFKFLSWKKRIRIALEWTLAIFFPRDITKLK